MIPGQTSRWGGLALIIGSALFIVNKFRRYEPGVFEQPDA